MLIAAVTGREFLDEAGDWRRFDPERDAYTRG